ncbi:AAA family ATPase [Geobacter hydrogenophilus]|uniref:Nuclease SbcCD subunit C n=1 Tax=Geobacter hydrogenophilus TaxID=40983 RepID=A0A9W6FXS4_9BACT|nr:AAA family ATPase [Geobacter hydrogenophilus]MBT0894828.1 AAA family ATPase [Geobacter hydrogenophilus]GLI36767.1 nuclease SbcCD subunit C [Geobacter hydrogenophilus]
MLWITSVQLPAFGRFGGEEFTFRRGMNLVCGKNEAGKSTILAAIAGTIFGFRREKDRFVPWGGGERCEARVSFAYDDREMTIVRDFLTDRVQAVERSGDRLLWRFEGKVSPAGRSSEREEYLAKIEEVWGFAEGDIFRNSVFVGQRDLKIEGDGALTTRIKQLLSGFSEMDYDAVVDSLEKELYELTRRPGGRAKDRELEEVRARMAELAEAWRTASRTMEEVGKAEAELAELRGFIDVGRADLDKGEKYLQRVKKYHEDTGREAVLRKEFDRIQAEREKVEALEAQRRTIEARLATLGNLTDLPDGFDRTIGAYCAASERLEQLEEEMAGLTGESDDVRKVPLGLLLSPILAWGAAVAAWFLVPASAYVATGIALVATLAVVVYAARLNSARNANASRRQGRIDGLAAETDRLRSEAARHGGAVAEHLGDIDPASARGVLEEMEGVEEIVAERDQVASALKVLSPLDDLKAQGTELARELAVVRETMESVVGKGFPVMSHEEFTAAEAKMQRLAGEVKEKERAALVKEQELAVLRTGGLDLEAIAEEGEELKSREQRLVRRTGALRLAVELLRETLDEYRATYLARLSSEINGKLYNLTAGRYREARLDDNFNLTIGADGELRPAEAYSCGVQDQAYLASRLALGGILSRGRKLPFLLDDPLVNFDDERKTAVLATLNLIASGHQVILFVHDERYLRLKGADLWNRIRIDMKGKPDGQLHLL